jgi:hypothetical protein
LDYNGPLFTKMRITAEQIGAQIRETGAKRAIERIEDLFCYELYYYPFYVIRAKGALERRFLHTLYKEAFLSVDAIKGYYAKAQVLPSIEYFEQDIAKQLAAGAVIFDPQISIEEAWERGVSGLRKSHSFSFHSAYWIRRQVSITPFESALIYKPYWRVKITGPRDQKTYIRVIDATSGEVGGQNAYRFLEGYDLLKNRSVI